MRGTLLDFWEKAMPTRGIPMQKIYEILRLKQLE